MDAEKQSVKEVYTVQSDEIESLEEVLGADGLPSLGASLPDGFQCVRRFPREVGKNTYEVVVDYDHDVRMVTKK